VARVKENTLRNTLVHGPMPASRLALTTLAVGYVLIPVSLLACSSASAEPTARSSQPELDDSGSSVVGDDTGLSTSEPDASTEGGSTMATAEAGTKPTADGGLPDGWLYTKGNRIYVSNGSGGTPWMGRGVNMDDIFLCAANSTLTMKSPEKTLEAIGAIATGEWKANFIRISLAMNSDTTKVTWSGDTAAYTTPMINAIKAISATPNVYVLVTLRSDATMIGEDQTDGDPEATGLPSDSTSTPDKSAYPTGTDATYVALVDAFANSSSILFGLTNEPGGDKLANATIAAAMNHGVGVIRAEENKLGVPHHVVAVQGNGWTSDLSFYAATPAPITHDNVVYELHYYPANGETAKNYAQSSTLPLIVGEYGSFTGSVTQSGFYADMESKGIPTLAWDFEPYSNCTPDLLDVTSTDGNLSATTWGSSVKTYLTSHAP
jgi:Cellulase (glycosyl hydrolase family 5)